MGLDDLSLVRDSGFEPEPLNTSGIAGYDSGYIQVGQFSEVVDTLKETRERWETELRDSVGPQHFSRDKVTGEERTGTEILQSWRGVMQSTREATLTMVRDMQNFREHYQFGEDSDITRVGMFPRGMTEDERRRLISGKEKGMFGIEYDVEVDPQTKARIRRKQENFLRGQDTRVGVGVGKDNVEAQDREGGPWYKRIPNKICDFFVTLFGGEKDDLLMQNVVRGYRKQLEKKKDQHYTFRWTNIGVAFCRLFGICKEWVARQGLKMYTQALRDAATDIVRGGWGSEFRYRLLEGMDNLSQTDKDEIEQDPRLQNPQLKPEEKEAIRQELLAAKMYERLVDQVLDQINIHLKEKEGWLWGNDSVFASHRLAALQELMPEGMDRDQGNRFLAEAITAALIAETFGEHIDQKSTVIAKEIDGLGVAYTRFDDEFTVDGQQKQGERSTPALISRVAESEELRPYLSGHIDRNVQKNVKARPGLHAGVFFGKLRQEFEENAKQLKELDDHIAKLKEDEILTEDLSTTLQNRVSKNYRTRNQGLIDQCGQLEVLFNQAIDVITHAPDLTNPESPEALKESLLKYRKQLEGLKQQFDQELQKLKEAEGSDPWLISTAEEFSRHLGLECDYHLKLTDEVLILTDEMIKGSVNHFESIAQEAQGKTPEDFLALLEDRANNLELVQNTSGEARKVVDLHALGSGNAGPLRSAMVYIGERAKYEAGKWNDLIRAQKALIEEVKGLRSGEISFDHAVGGLSSYRHMFTGNPAEKKMFQAFRAIALQQVAAAGLEKRVTGIPTPKLNKITSNLLSRLPVPVEGAGILPSEQNFLEPLAKALEGPHRDFLIENLSQDNVAPEVFRQCVDRIFVEPDPLSGDAPAFGLVLKLETVPPDETKARNQILLDHYSLESSRLFQAMRESGQLTSGLSRIGMESGVPQEDGKMLAWLRNVFFPKNDGSQFQLESLAAKRAALEALRSGGSLDNEETINGIVAQLRSDGFRDMTVDRLTDLLFGSFDKPIESGKAGFARFSEARAAKPQSLDSMMKSWATEIRSFARNLNNLNLGGTTESQAQKLLSHLGAALLQSSTPVEDSEQLEWRLLRELGEKPVPEKIMVRDPKSGQVREIDNPEYALYQFHLEQERRISSLIDEQEKAQRDSEIRLEEVAIPPGFKDDKFSRDGATAVVRFLHRRDQIHQKVDFRSTEYRLGIKLFGSYVVDPIRMDEREQLSQMHWFNPETGVHVGAGTVQLTWCQPGSDYVLQDQSGDHPTFVESRDQRSGENMERVLRDTVEGRELVKVSERFVRSQATRTTMGALKRSNESILEFQAYHKGYIEKLRGKSTQQTWQIAVRAAIIDVFLRSNQPAENFKVEDHLDDIRKRLFDYGAGDHHQMDDLIRQEIPTGGITDELITRWSDEMDVEVHTLETTEMIGSLEKQEKEIVQLSEQSYKLMEEFEGPDEFRGATAEERQAQFREVLLRVNQDLWFNFTPEERGYMEEFVPREGISNRELLRDMAVHYATMCARTDRGLDLLVEFHSKVERFARVQEFEKDFAKVYQNAKPEVQKRLMVAMRRSMDEELARAGASEAMRENILSYVGEDPSKFRPVDAFEFMAGAFKTLQQPYERMEQFAMKIESLI